MNLDVLTGCWKLKFSSTKQKLVSPCPRNISLGCFTAGQQVTGLQSEAGWGLGLVLGLVVGVRVEVRVRLNQDGVGLFVT